MIDNPPEFLKEWSRQIGAELKDGLRENPSWIAFARENGTVYHTYTVSAPDPFVAPYFSFLAERTPKGSPDGRWPRARTSTRSDAQTDGNVGIVVEDLEATIEFFRELGL